MDKVAKLREGDRRDLFRQTAANRGFHPAIAEKDFWVCWVLMKLFGDTTLQDQIVFKGGTSLSKVHHLIDRFSEDIDLVLNWELLGYGKGKSDPWLKLPSNTQLDKFNKEFNQKAAHYIANTLLAHIRTLLSSCSDIRAEISGEDSQAISIFLPSILPAPIAASGGSIRAWSSRFLGAVREVLNSAFCRRGIPTTLR